MEEPIQPYNNVFTDICRPEYLAIFWCRWPMGSSVQNRFGMYRFELANEMLCYFLLLGIWNSEYFIILWWSWPMGSCVQNKFGKVKACTATYATCDWLLCNMSPKCCLQQSWFTKCNWFNSNNFSLCLIFSESIMLTMAPDILLRTT